MKIKEYSELCEKNYNNIYVNNKHFWDEDNVSDYLAYCFQDERIFKDFLKSVKNNPSKEPTCELNDELINGLEYTRYHFPKVRVLTQTTPEKPKIMDILTEGKNFICVIEVKFGSKEQNKQCWEYKNEIEQRCKLKGKTPICIFIDSEHGHNYETDNFEDEFSDKEEYNGYYLGWFGKNVLKTLQNAENKYDFESDFKEDFELFKDFLTEVEFNNEPVLATEINNRRSELKQEIEKILNKSVEYNKYYDAYYINGKSEPFLKKHEYIALLEKPDKITENEIRSK